jgi:hypothetical protein
MHLDVCLRLSPAIPVFVIFDDVVQRIGLKRVQRVLDRRVCNRVAVWIGVGNRFKLPAVSRFQEPRRLLAEPDRTAAMFNDNPVQIVGGGTRSYVGTQDLEII